MNEHGPFRINDLMPPVSLYRFDYTWAKLANMVYLESPVGTGFTYSDDVEEYCNSDNSTVLDNYLAIEKFFELFPEYRRNDFYLTGESYAGIYVPTLAEAIIEATIKETYKGAPLKGIAVGNGCIGTEVGVCKSDHKSTFQAQFYVQNSAFLKQELKDTLEENCDWNTPYDISDECKSLTQEAETKRLGLKNPYDMYSREERSNATKVYLNLESVKEAISVNPDIEWMPCSCSVVNVPKCCRYNKTRPNLPRDTYPFLNEHIRVLIYNGDWDPKVPYTDNERWNKDMGYDVAEDWHPWFYNSRKGIKEQVGGYATRYNTTFNFTFITVRGGSHMVPETAPVSSFEMIFRFLNDIAF